MHHRIQRKKKDQEEEMEEAEHTRSSARSVAREKGSWQQRLTSARYSTFYHQEVSARANLQARALPREESQNRERGYMETGDFVDGNGSLDFIL